MGPGVGYFFEVSWEVCNKVGGIYTVVSSKAEFMAQNYKDYYLIGPYFLRKAAGEFQESVAPEKFKPAFDSLRNMGITCHFGKWLIDGMPNVILIDFSEFTRMNNEIKTKLWDDFRIDSLGTSFFDFDEPNIWSYSAGMLIGHLDSDLRGEASEGDAVVAQFHEWLSASGLLYLRKNHPRVATVFTTHATMLGRTLASNNIDLYSHPERIDADSEANRFGIHTKHQTEKAAAKNADIFTTVSEITGLEAEHFLGRRPDIILPNGLNISKFPTMEEVAIRHKHFKTKIKSFLLYYFFPYQKFDLDETLLFFIVGRYEYHDKGIDVFIKALGKLNSMLKKSSVNKTIVAFFWIPANVRGIKGEIIENRTNYMDIHESIEDAMPDIKNNLILSLTTGATLSETSILGNDLVKDLRKKRLKLAKRGSPLLSTHDLHDENNDAILNGLRDNGLVNSPEDKVKVVYYPIYLTGADGLLDLGYYEAMAGAHLGVFPSYYEPWGYTPLEAAALGVASVTTDLAGFGKYISKNNAFGKYPGIYIINRQNRSDADVVEDLAGIFFNYANLAKEERIANKYEARKVASNADWLHFSKFYFEAHRLALQRKSI